MSWPKPSSERYTLTKTSISKTLRFFILLVLRRREVPEAVMSGDLTLISQDSKYLQLCFGKIQTLLMRGK